MSSNFWVVLFVFVPFLILALMILFSGRPAT